MASFFSENASSAGEDLGQDALQLVGIGHAVDAARRLAARVPAFKVAQGGEQLDVAAQARKRALHGFRRAIDHVVVAFDQRQHLCGERPTTARVGP